LVGDLYDEKSGICIVPSFDLLPHRIEAFCGVPDVEGADAIGAADRGAAETPGDIQRSLADAFETGSIALADVHGISPCDDHAVGANAGNHLTGGIAKRNEKERY